MNNLWRRPSALSLANYATISVDSLFRHYMHDNEQAANVKDPPAKPSRAFRVCQWNVHYFCSTDSSGGCVRTFNKVFTELMRHDPDVIVLNEFAAEDPNENLSFLRRLENEGYKHLRAADIHFPTVVLVRYEGEVDHIEDFALDLDRRAVMIGLKLPEKNESQQDSIETTKPRHLWIYGTHLHHVEDFPGRRLSEMKNLMNHVQNRPQTDAFLIVGDFNQQREQDYTPTEWRRIVANKAHRTESFTSDGVAELLQRTHGFTCVWDNALNRNWPATDPPPATHWSGTVIDYTYSRNLQNVGAYVSSMGSSDHRLVISDWTVS